TGLFISNFEDYFWKICINDPLKDHHIIDFFLFSDPKKLQSTIPFQEYSFLYPIFDHLLNSNPHHPVLICWMNWMLEKQEFFDS
ncbi:hypothetical protein, partial [Xanthomonas campestris]|uniref:hypothetical protein n=1 Tax=Xanthomonas campestris TaxID=339 RepID=UPI003CF06678